MKFRIAEFEKDIRFWEMLIILKKIFSRYLLKDYDTSLPMYFGRKFKQFVKQGYMSGGAGYVLSKEALRR